METKSSILQHSCFFLQKCRFSGILTAPQSLCYSAQQAFACMLERPHHTNACHPLLSAFPHRPLPAAGEGVVFCILARTSWKKGPMVQA
jgi:hypothetical protein